MNLLAIDTSTDSLSIAIQVNDAQYCEEQVGIRQHAECVLPMIDRMLTTAGILCHQLDAIVFGQGPGSFTGLRIACSVAKGLAYAHDLPLFPVSGLAAIAHQAFLEEPSQNHDVRILAMLDARMHQVYWGCFTPEVYDAPEQVAFAPDIVIPEGRPVLLAGVGFETYVSQLSDQVQGLIVKQVSIFPNALSMIQLVELGHIKSVNAAAAVPVYIRNQVTQGGTSGG